MRVLIDTNILVSAAYSNGSVPYHAFKKAVNPPYRGLICEQSLEEMRRVFNRKFPDRIPLYEAFIAMTLAVVEVVPVPPSPHPDEDEIRDVTDRPILRTAIQARADILLSGDKDFTESAITNPTIMTAAQFLETTPKNDPFYSKSNLVHLRRGVEALNRGKGVEHDIIEIPDEDD